jgi:peptidoglycan hydrolase-like protein with peptidoglycan-binding domain
MLLVLLPLVPMGGGSGTVGDPAFAQRRQRVRSRARAFRKPAARSQARATSAERRRVVRRRSRKTVRRLVLRPGGLIPRERVREIQQALIERGFLEGPPTGVYDAQTVEAMKRFQHAEGIEETGYPTAHALYRLGLHPASSGGSSSSSARRSPPSG